MRSENVPFLPARPIRCQEHACSLTEPSFSFLKKSVKYLLSSGCYKASLCPYAIADATLMHLTRLKGSLLTNSLYPYFMIVADT
ncbi:hypothetical protein GOP47_0011424 [Adiantum capillus-veneris]|uniref:Uncharacterized protein n=1 Tax=Adiantum capillus-veneris TaxID=13818 RepID=A0A9D4UT90_ADICA|nr:hypothetical protein GOP47_0011424 [Adiantum capillus-veneris]